MMRIGLLGASRIAPNAIIAPAARRADVTVSAVAARDHGRAARFAAEHQIPAVAASYGELVTRDDVDVVYCALPAPLHLDICEQALAAGKALLVEKPFAENAAAAKRIVAVAEAAGRPALEAFHYRFHAQFEHALALVKSGALGRIVRVEGVFDVPIARTPGELRWDKRLGGGAMMDLGCYVAHALRTLLGKEPVLQNVEATVTDGVDESLWAKLAFGEVQAVLSCSMTRPIKAELKIEGEDGVMTLHRFVAPQHGGRLTLQSRTGLTEDSSQGPTTYEAQLEHLVQVWRGEAQPLTGEIDAIANMAVIDACRAGAQDK